MIINSKKLILLTIISLFCNLKCADVNEEFLTAVHRGNLEQVKNLIGKVNINEIRDAFGNPPLIIVSQYFETLTGNPEEYFKIFELLLQNKADVNVKNKSNETALSRLFHRTLYDRDLRAVNVLLQRGADVTPLYTNIDFGVVVLASYLANRSDVKNPNDLHALELLLLHGVGYKKNGELIIYEAENKPFLSFAYKKLAFKEIIKNFFSAYTEPYIIITKIKDEKLSGEQKKEIIDFLKAIKIENIDEALKKVSEMKDKAVADILSLALKSAINKRILTRLETEDQKKADEEFLFRINQYIWILQ